MNRGVRLFWSLLSHGWWWRTLIVLIVMATFVRLGFWQLDRLQQRRAENAQLRQVLTGQPLQLAGDNLAGAQTAVPDQMVAIRGEFDFENQLLLKLQTWQGQAGVNLITPLRIEGSDAAVLIDRGWIPEAEAEAGRLGQYNVPGPVDVSGYVSASEQLSRSNGDTLAPPTPRSEWFRVDVEAIQHQMPYRLLPFFVRQVPPAEGNLALPFRRERDLDLSDGPHLSYAVQWFLFASVAGIGYLVLVYRRLEEGNASVFL